MPRLAVKPALKGAGSRPASIARASSSDFGSLSGSAAPPGFCSSVLTRCSRVEPLAIGHGNCMQMLGLSWSAARRLARELGVHELRVSERKVLLPARELFEALHARSLKTPVLNDAAEREAMRAALGLELVEAAE